MTNTDKTLSIRLGEVIELRKKMIKSGLTENMAGVKQFIEILNVFFKEGKEQFGKIYISELDKYLHYGLTNNAFGDNVVSLKSD
jgi:hypothetical protein